MGKGSENHALNLATADRVNLGPELAFNIYKLFHWAKCRAMHATWKFQSVRYDGSRRVLRRPNGDSLTGTHNEALDFAARAQVYLSGRGVERIEAWSCGAVRSEPNESPRTIFRLRPHENGHDWRADITELHHGGWYRKLTGAIDYTLFRGAGRVCEIQIFDKMGMMVFVVLADLRGHDAVPFVAPNVF